MKIFAIVMLTFLLAHRIKNTPRALNRKRLANELEESRKTINDFANPIISQESFAKFLISTVLWTEVVLAIFYATLGFIQMPASIFFGWLSFLQMLTCFISMCKNIKLLNIIFNNEEFPTPKLGFNICNLILDYIYYPYAIYLLLI